MKYIKFFLAVTVLLSLCLLSYAAEQISSKPAKRYVITDYGAVTDPNIVNTKAIQDTIDKCASDGGGTVVVPAGTFITGAIFFKQGVNLEIEADGVLKGTTNMADYKLVQTRWEGEERIWVSALVNVFDMTGFRLSGKGTIDGSGDVWFSRGRGGFGAFGGGARGTQVSQSSSPGNVGPVREGPPSLGIKGGLPAVQDSPAYELREVQLPAYARPRLIAIQNCNDVVVENLTFKNQSSWCLFVLYSKKVEIRNLIIRAEHNIPSSDGIDIDSCDGVHIVGVDIDVNDDCIAIKSGKDADGRRVNRPAENILVEKCMFRYGHGGVSMGSEMSGGIRNVEIRDSVMSEDNWAPIRFKSQPSRGGVVENITYRDIELKNTKKAFEFNMAWNLRGPSIPSDPLPVVRNVKIINVSGTTNNVGDMYGLKDSPIVNVSFENCNIKAQRGFTLENVENLDLSGLKIEVEQGEAVIRRNTK
ncbi:MAG: glycoside hydrolase family 28 protein [Sedimentisphaerales bacterium]|nr:glycoside hydrolase family 28 protein [Sedimentisphaerales bacterium]